MKELRIIVTGDRNFLDYNLLSDTIMQYLEDMDDTDIVDNPDQVKFVSGGAEGADVLGEQFAYTYGYDVMRFAVDSKNVREKRDIDMIKYASKEGSIGMVIAFWNGRNRETKFITELAKKFGLKVCVVNYSDQLPEKTKCIKERGGC